MSTSWLFYFVFATTLVLRLLPGNLQNMPFTMDQGRDLIEVRQLWQGRDLKVIGPTTSLNGVYLGPFYYYLISIPHLISSGNPQSVLVWQIIFFHLAVIFFWKTVKRHHSELADFVSLLLLISPISFYANRYFWNANFMLSFTLIYLALSIDILLSKVSPKKDLLLGLVAGLSLQIEAAFGIIFLPFSLLILATTKSTLPRYSRFLVSFFITLLPQIIFELAKGFPMTKVFLRELSGATNTLGESLSFSERLVQRQSAYFVAFHQSSHIIPSILIYIFVFSILIFLFYKNKTDQKAPKWISATSLLFLVLSLVFYLSYSASVKSWYIFSLSLVFPIFIVSAISLLKQKSLLYKPAIGLILLLSLVAFYRSQQEYLGSIAYKKPNDPSAYINQIKVVDDVYKLADGKSFYVYNYIPSVYDYPFQYLFWSHGLKKYGYSPNDLAYLPNQPEYIKEKNQFLKNTKAVTNQTPTILIIQEGENISHLRDWLGNFAHLCQENKIEYPFNQKVLYLTTCSKK